MIIGGLKKDVLLLTGEHDETFREAARQRFKYVLLGLGC